MKDKIVNNKIYLYNGEIISLEEYFDRVTDSQQTQTEMKQMDSEHSKWKSPYNWRYGSHNMRYTWSEVYKRRLWRQIWVEMAEAQMEAGLTTLLQVEELRENQDRIDIERSIEFENQLHHDLMAEVHTYGEQCPAAKGIIHLGATSMDIEDNADAIRLKEAMDLTIQNLDKVLLALAGRINEYADLPTMAFTHLQPAEPTTVGYRLAWHGQDLLSDRKDLKRLYSDIKGKGFKGAVGTSASYRELFKGTSVTAESFEKSVMGSLELESFDVTSQTYPRKQDLRILNALSCLGQTLYKFAFDLRILQSPPFGELAEPFGSKQIGSSAMPFKRNPINAENIDSLARLLATLPRVAWDNAAHSLLERTLDDSGNRRTILPQAFLIVDELLKKTKRIINGLNVSEEACQRLMRTYGTFAATEKLLMLCVRRGADRQEIHEVIREHSMAAWQNIKSGSILTKTLSADSRIQNYLSVEEIRESLKADDYVGIAPERSLKMSELIQNTLEE
jgi:adenylosuccinate lyase